MALKIKTKPSTELLEGEMLTTAVLVKLGTSFRRSMITIEALRSPLLQSFLSTQIQFRL